MQLRPSGGPESGCRRHLRRKERRANALAVVGALPGCREGRVESEVRDEGPQTTGKGTGWYPNPNPLVEQDREGSYLSTQFGDA